MRGPAGEVDKAEDIIPPQAVSVVTDSSDVTACRDQLFTVPVPYTI